MKKILMLLMILIFVSSAAFAAGNESLKPNETGQGPQIQQINEIQNTGEGQNLTIYENQTTQKKGQVKLKIEEKKQELEQKLQNLTAKEQNIYRNQNQVRLAVHSLLAMENLTGGIGPQISAIARGFNNSVQATIRAEEKIQNRSKIKKFFIGGDEKAADELEQEILQNQERLRELEQLIGECGECDEETRAMLQEQLQNIEQEQNRLRELAQAEKKSKGLLGWMWK